MRFQMGLYLGWSLQQQLELGCEPSGPLPLEPLAAGPSVAEQQLVAGPSAAGQRLAAGPFEAG